MRLSQFAFLLFQIFPSWAQQIITGTVHDQAGEAIIGANVYIRDSYDGATTDIEGNFSFETFESGESTLVISFVGYHDHLVVLDLYTTQEFFNVQLREKIDELNSVVITAGAFEASDEAKRTVMKSLDIVTTAGATADITGALNTLPGTQTVGETGRLFVRGGEGHETKTFIDGMLVHDEYGPTAPNTPSRSRFSPFIFKGTSFSTGGYSAEYGQALSSALILESKDIATQQRSDVSLMTVGADVAHTQLWENSSFSGKLQYTNLTPYFALVKQKIKWNKAPEEWMGNVAYRIQTPNSGSLKIYTNFSHSTMDLYQQEIGNPDSMIPMSITNDYGYVNVVYKGILSDKWFLKTGLAATQSNSDASLDSNRAKQNLTGRHAKATFTYQHSDRFALHTGGELLYRKSAIDLKNSSDQFLDHFSEFLPAGFVEGEIYLSTKFAIRVGGRGEYNSLTQKSTFAPRTSLAHKLGESGQVSLAYGKFYQSAQETDLHIDHAIGQDLSTHYIANYQWVKNLRTFRVEGYMKQYNDLIRFTEKGVENSGDGFARGFDLWWRDAETFEGWDYWVSYSFLDTKREYRDFPGEYVPSFASAHNLSLVFKKWLSGWNTQIGGTYTYGSPRTFTNPNKDGFLQSSTPSYHDFSMNVSYLLNSQVIIHGLVNNVFGFTNIYGYEYSDTPGTDGIYPGRPITQTAKRFIFLGVFITLSKDKSINQLPNL